MKIRNQITLLFLFLTASILGIYAIIIYISAKIQREKEFYMLLQKEAITKANLFLDAKIPEKTLHEIYKNNRKTLNEIEVAIYNSDFQLIYHDAVEIDFVKETNEMLKEILNKRFISFYQQDWQVVGVLYRFNNQNFIITASAYDGYGYNKLNALLQNLILAFLFAIAIIFFLGKYLASYALKPIQTITQKMQQITAIHLNLRLPIPNYKDEISELSKTFNEMLDRLEDSFNHQKHFVSHVAHELRTPLTAMITEIQLTLQNVQDPNIKNSLKNLFNDTQKLSKLTKSLLDLAKAQYDPSQITFQTLRIDELLLDAIQEIQNLYPHYHIELCFDENFSVENSVEILGNEYLLKIAFSNIIENAYKFSQNHTSWISIGYNSDLQKLWIKFEDQGIGIPEEDLQNILKPFYRGKNHQIIEGTGIGLYLTQKIIHLHKAKLNIQSQVGIGTTIWVEF